MSKKTIVKFTLDPANPPPLTPKQIAMLDALEKMPDSEIDFSDIPEQHFLYKPIKKIATIRLDADVLAWLRGFGKGYQSRINAILRHEMLAATEPKTAAKRRGRAADGRPGQRSEPRRLAPTPSTKSERRPKISASMA